MGLDMYAYVASRKGQQNDFYEDAEWDPVLKESVNPKVERPRELAYWRKHPNLHGWMADLWMVRETGGEGETEHFNGVELELTREDLDELEQAVINGELPSTRGFFFGDESDEYYRKQDLEFIKQARAELFCGLKVFYNSSW